MAKLVGVDWHLGPEMKSTGEVMGIDHNFAAALTKALLAAKLNLREGIGVLLSIADQHKAEAVSIIQGLNRAGCRLYATEGTASMISAMDLPVTMTTKKLSEGHPNVVDVINDGSVGAVINTITGVSEVLRDGFHIRRAAVERQIPCFTSLDTARAAVESLLAGHAAYAIGTTSDYLNGSGSRPLAQPSEKSEDLG
jgi:carbamoyl-phosphate synthase large subunit